MKHDHQIEYNQSRREFFTKLALASLAATLPPMALGCSEKPEFQGSGKAPYKVWEEMLHYLKTSPDYLKGRMERLIKEGNPEAMFNFVRDEIYLIPAKLFSIGNGNSYKWGLEYALRSGMATMREKAELLHGMYQKAGISSKIITERTDIKAEDAPAFFFRPVQRDFLPEISKGMLRQWQKELGTESASVMDETQWKSEEGDATALGERVLRQLNLPDDQYYKPFDFRWPNYQTPAIEFEWEGKTNYAHLFDPKVTFGQLRSASVPKESVEAQKNEEKVRLTLSYCDSITPLKEKELITGEWLASELVGHQLDVRFLNNLTLEEQVVTPVGNLKMFTPALSLQAMDADLTFMQERSFLGNPITLSGKQILLEGDDQIAQIGDAIIRSKPSPDLQKEVMTMNAKANPTGYPGAKLSVSPYDVQGKIIEGLSASDFSITEDGKPIRALLENNQQTPRILIMSDTSMSMPNEYRGKGMDAFIYELRRNILEKYPAAIIDFWQTPSSLFTWLLKASLTENDLIIYATDGDNNDSYDEKNEALFQSGPPALILNVHNTKNTTHLATFEKMAAVSGGMHLPINNQKEAQEGIQKYLENIEVAPYTFTYNSVGETEKRNVKIELDKGRVTAQAAYSFDLTNEQIGPKIIGLYLELKYSNQYPVKRVLAGWDPTVRPKDKPSKSMADEVNDFFLGSMQLYFEGAGPTFSVSLCDLLKARLSTRKWGEALIEDNIGKTRKTYQEGFYSIDDKALMLMAPLSSPSTDASLTVPGALRIGMRTVTPGCMTEASYSSFDYLRTSNFVTLSKNPKEGFSITTRKTAQLALRENWLFQKSTFSELNDKNWIDLKSARENKWFSEHREKDNYYWRERIDRGATFRVFDKDANSRAFWNIDKSNGELYGILSDQSGGGADLSHNDIMDALAKIIDLMNRIKVLHPIGAVALGIVAEYGKTLVKLYAFVSEAILIMDTSGMNDKIKEELQDFACTVAKSIVSASSDKAGEIMAGLDDLIAGINGKGIPCG